MKNRRRKKFNPYLKIFLCEIFARTYIFANYQIRNISRGLNFAVFANLPKIREKPRNLIHAKINPLKVLN